MPLLPSLLDSLHLRLFEAANLTLPAGRWNTPNVQSSFWRFYRNEEDGARLVLPSGPFPLAAGRLYFVPAQVKFHCANDASFRHFYVHFDVIGLPGVVARELFAGPVCLTEDAGLEAGVDEMAERLTAEREWTLAGQCRLKGLLFSAMARAFDDASPERLARGWSRAAALRPVLPAIEHVEEHLGEPLPNAKLARLCCLSETQFGRRFRDGAGVTPAQYVLERRVTMAAQRLLFSDDSIETIADALGFGSRFYFSRAFARQIGIAPAAFRRVGRI